MWKRLILGLTILFLGAEYAQSAEVAQIKPVIITLAPNWSTSRLDAKISSSNGFGKWGANALGRRYEYKRFSAYGVTRRADYGGSEYSSSYYGRYGRDAVSRSRHYPQYGRGYYDYIGDPK